MEPSATAYRHMSRHGFEPGLLIALADHLHHTFRSQHSLTLSQSKFYYLSIKAESICFGFQTFQPLTSKTRAINVSWFQHYRSHSFKSNGRGSQGNKWSSMGNRKIRRHVAFRIAPQERKFRNGNAGSKYNLPIDTSRVWLQDELTSGPVVNSLNG